MPRLATLLATAALAGGLASPTLAADSATVAAEVTMAAPCLTTETPNISFGILTFSPDTGPAGTSQQPIRYVSCSDLDELVFVHGTDATAAGGVGWTLGAVFTGCPDDGLNRFGLTLLASDTGLASTVGRFESALGAVSPGRPGNYDVIEFRAPCAGSDGAGTVMSFDIVFTASF
jgi:hypothetical protein